MAKKDNRHAELVSASVNIEAPYELPEGWKWTRLGDVFEVNPKIKADDELSASFVPMEKIEANHKNVFSFSVGQWGTIRKGHTQFQNGDVCFAKISPCFENGKAFIAHGLENGIGAGTTELVVLRNKDIDCNYTFHFISTENFIRKGCTTYSGTVGQQRISMDFVKNMPFPLPPTLAEQQRIVNRIESMFAKLDEAKEKVQSVVDSFETRKAAILHKAFTGELTANWRKENGVADESWEEKTIGECFKFHSGDCIKVRNAKIGDFPIYGGNGINGYYDKTNVDSETIVIGRVGFYCGSVHITESAAWVTDNALIVEYDKTVFNALFIAYLMKYKNLGSYSNSSAQPVISGKTINPISIKICSLPEQQEIVRILDSVLEKERTAKEAAGAVLDQIALLKKSILARAFRGKI